MRRRHRIAFIALSGACAAAIATPAIAGWAAAQAQQVSDQARTPPANAVAADTEPVFPRPGGGPRVIQSYSSIVGTGTYLLDAETGGYRKLPYNGISVSPDGVSVAVESYDGRIGVADRRGLLQSGDAAVGWTTLPPGSPSWWSPDGAALLVTTFDKETRESVAHRYDVATQQLRRTLITLACDICTAGWAADSHRYIVALSGADPNVPIGPMQYLNPDGTAGPLVGGEGYIWSADAYSPSRRYAIAEPPRPGVALFPHVVDLEETRVVATIETGWPVLGWYDEEHVVRFPQLGNGEPPMLDVVNVHTGAVIKRVPAPQFSPAAIIQIGSSDGLTGAAAELGF